MRERKTLAANQLRVGQKFVCYKIGTRMCYPARDHVKSITDAGVIIYNPRNSDDPGELISKDALFQVELSNDEFNQLYHNAARSVYEALAGGEYVGDHGCHEMYNAWVGSSIQEMYKKLEEENWKLVGWFWLQEVKHGWFSDCDIGVVAEDEKGERFWCHWQKSDIDDICERYLKEEKRMA